jgi:hypothetical protein
VISSFCLSSSCGDLILAFVSGSDLASVPGSGLALWLFFYNLAVELTASIKIRIFLSSFPPTCLSLGPCLLQISLST